MDRKFNSKGFTIVELLVVIFIIALLVVAVIAIVGRARAKARDSQRAANVDQISKAIEMYAVTEEVYPDDIYSDLPPIYIDRVPMDPSRGTRYGYAHSNSTCFVVRAELERNVDLLANDIDGTDVCVTGFNCNDSPRLFYCKGE